jgi:hypothetical protein
LSLQLVGALEQIDRVEPHGVDRFAMCHRGLRNMLSIRLNIEAKFGGDNVPIDGGAA